MKRLLTMVRSHRCIVLALVVAAALSVTTPAMAQEAPVAEETDPTTGNGEGDLPTGPPTDPSEADEADAGPIVLDLSDAVSVDEEGNTVWRVEETTTAADDAVSEPTPLPAGGTEGTGQFAEELTPATETTSTDDEGAPGLRVAVDQSDSVSTVVLFGSIAGVVAMVIGGAVYGRRRSAAAMSPEVVETILPVSDDMAEPAAPDLDTQPAYAGAAEAGAYEVGGAAYAQYTEPDYSAAGEGVADLGDGPRTKLDQLRSSVVDMADKGLADAGRDRLVAQKLEAAGSSMRPGEWLVLAAVFTVCAFGAAMVLFGPILGVAAAVLVAIGFWSMLSFQEGKRQRAFAEALPETLQLLAGSLRGGLSMMQSIQTVADEADEPTAGEFQRVVTESRLGRDLAVAFREMSRRMDSKDFEWVVTAIEIHREVGGDLAAILDRVGNTIRARNRVRGQVKALSAEGKMSGLILFFLPPGMVLAIATLNRAYLDEMLNTTEGQIMLVVSGVLLLIGGFWLKRLSRFVY